METRITASPVIDLQYGRAQKLEVDRDFDVSVERSPVPQNTAATPWAGRTMIKDLFIDIWDVPERQDDIIAIEFDRQALLFMLAQNGCEGIRFGFCKFNNRKTLVGFGIKNDGSLIGQEMFRIGAESSGKTPVIGFEQGHGLTLGDFKKIIKSDDKNFDRISEQFFTSPLF